MVQTPERVILRLYRADPYKMAEEREAERSRIANAYTALTKLPPHPCIPAARDFFATEEMATMPIPGVNQLPKPLATVVFHYSQTQDYKPEFTSMNKANDDEKSLKTLMEDYAASGKPLSDVVLLAPEGKLVARRSEYPGIEVLPLKFASSELQAGHWR